MTFEEVKEIFKKSIDATDTMNQAIENFIQSIYLKGYNEALEQEIFDIETYCKEHFMVMVDKDVWEKAEKALKQESKTGKWILSGGYWRCSKCKEKALLKLDKSKGGCREYMPIRSDFCPNCGAKMESEEE